MGKKDVPPPNPENSLQEVHKLLVERKQEEKTYTTEKGHPAAVASSSAEAEAYKRRLHEMEEQARLEKAQQEAQKQEEHRRLEAAERHAHAEGQAQMDAFRQEWYLRTYAAQPWPLPLLVLMIIGCVGLGIATGLGMHQWSQLQLQELTQKQETALEEAVQESNKERNSREKELAHFRTEIQGQQAQASALQKQIEDRKIALHLKEQADAAAQREQEAENRRQQAIQAEKDAKFERCKGSDDPLCGVDGKSGGGSGKGSTGKTRGATKKKTTPKKESALGDSDSDIL